MRIALCDDETAYHETIQNLIKEYKAQHCDYTFSLSSFSSGKGLLNHVDEYGGFDLYILDCIMPEMDGIQTGRALRDRDDTGMIIYITTSPSYALDSYQVEALNYLLKPVDKNKFFHNLDRAYHYFSRHCQEVVKVKTPDSTCVVQISNIRFAERTGKQITYYLADNTSIRSATFNGSFKTAVEGLLAHEEMLLVGSSFVVNLSHVTEVKKYNLTLTGSIYVPVPHRLYETVKATWADFWLEGGRYQAF